jgi:ATP-dependent helicase/nuclease subunit B
LVVCILSLRFIIGRAGSGKTRACLDAIRAELTARPAGPPLIFLVPEQATFQTEYSLASTPDLKGFIRAQVLSFRRLAFRVLQEAGGSARPHIGDLGKRMLLRRLLEQRRDKIRIFQRSISQPGFADTLARTLGEIKNYCIEPGDLVSASTALREIRGAEMLAEKLEDLYLLYNDLDAVLEDRFIDPDDYLNLLADRLSISNTVRGGEVWVDGFSGYTPQEYRVLSSLLNSAARVNITLCTDLKAFSGSPDETELFYPIRETYDTLCELAARERVVVERSLTLDDTGLSRYKSPGISHLEKYYFKYPAPVRDNCSSDVILAGAANPRAETEGAAREITALCRDAGYRYRDIIILLRNVDTYHDLISNVFADYNIPVFIDQKLPVMHHPLVELIRSALEVYISDWSFNPVFRFLKTDLTALGREEIDLLENYVLAHGIRGSRWTDEKPWLYRRRLSLEEDTVITDVEEEELDAINVIRRQVTSCLTGFFSSVCHAANLRDMTGAIFNLLAGLGVPALLECWSRMAEKEGRLESSREHSQVWSALTGMLDQVVEALGDEVMSVEEYAAVLDTGFDSMRLGQIPPGLDQVVVCSLERSRSPEARAAFVMGVSEGVLPARVSDGGILSEGERERLQAVGLKLAPGSRRRVFDEQYLVYIALTRSSEKLYLSYPLADDEGGAVALSTVAARVRELLPGLKEKFWPVEPEGTETEDLDFVSSPGRTLPHLVTRLREMKAGRCADPLWQDVYSWFMRSEYKKTSSFILSGIFASNREGRLSSGLGRALYGHRLHTNVSAIEKFRACPFAHFLARGLRLQERNVYKVGSPDLGQFFHAALKLYGDRVRELGLGWGHLDEKTSRDLAGDMVDMLTPRLQSEILLSSARWRYLTGKLKKTVQQSAQVLTEHSRRGCFQPIGLELAFGPDEDIPAVILQLPGNSEMVLSGRIDRVDSAVGSEGVYLRIIDYKSGRVTVSLQDIYHGLKLQLLAYLDVVLRYAEVLAGGRGLPGAMLYFRIDDPLVKTDGEIPPAEDLQKMILREFRMSGLLLADPEAVRLMDNSIAGDSDLIPVQMKKNGEFSARSQVISTEQFDLLREHLRRQLVSAGSYIAGGVVDISPYRRGAFRSCLYCPYKPVCKFDVLFEGNNYRLIKPEEDKEIWNRLIRLRGEKDG